MRERVAGLLGPGVSPPWSSLPFDIARGSASGMRRVRFDSNFSIRDWGDSRGVLSRTIEDAMLADSPPFEVVRARIEQAKNEAISPTAMAAAAASSRETSIASLYRLYQDRMRAINAMDFADLQMQAWTLFEEHPEVLTRWQSRAEHLLVDEYQDTNRVQYLLVRALSASSGNLCVVGDEDQSIYRWRGADIRNILDFENDYPNAAIFKLEQNYRSTKVILAAAGGVIRNNTQRKSKTLWTENESGEPVVYFTGMTERDEADFVAREIARLTSSDAFKPSEFVVFYRVNAQSRVIEEALVRRRIPYYVVGGVRFYEQRDVKDLIAYLRVIVNPADAVSLERMVATPSRGIGARTVEVVNETAARQGVTPFDALGRLETESRVALRIAKAAGSLYAWMRDLAANATTMPVRDIIGTVVAQSGFEAYLDTLADATARKQNLAELLAAAAAFDNEGEPGRLADFLERVALVSDADQVATMGGRAALMTLHTSKGLEYPVVFIAGMEEGLFPHSRSQDSSDEVEEERRLCYVGMTRARRLLYLSNTLSRELYGTRQETRPSRFLAEIDGGLLKRIAPERPRSVLRDPTSSEPYVDYSDGQISEDDSSRDPVAVGARVQHATFGRGVVKRREGRGDTAKAWVNFDRAGLKLLVLKFANLKLIAD